MVLDHVWTFGYRFVWPAQGILYIVKSEQKVRVFLAFPKTMAGLGHSKRIWKDAFRVAGAVQETCSSEILGTDFLRGQLHFGASDLAALRMTWHHFFVAGSGL